MFGWKQATAATSALVLALGCGSSSRDETDVSGGSGGTSGGTAGSGGNAGSAGLAAGTQGGGAGGSAGSAGGSAGSTGRGGAGGDSGDGGDGGSNAGRGAEGGGGAGDPGAIDAMLEALNEAVGAFCAAARTCCQGVPETDLDGCEDAFADQRSTPESIKNGAITLDDAALSRCKAAYEGSEQCNLNAVVAACHGLYVGQRRVGEPCISGFDCDRSAGAMTCLVSDTSVEKPTGVCAEVPHGQMGESCLTTCYVGEDCSATTTYGGDEASPMCFEDDGLVCSIETSTCQPVLALGEMCLAPDVCGSRAICNSTCDAVSDLGEACGSGCFHSLQCSEEGECVDPPLSASSACLGNVLGF